jgi:hypothetical protein
VLTDRATFDFYEQTNTFWKNNFENGSLADVAIVSVAGGFRYNCQIQKLISQGTPL